jgi:hypothetical protein
VSNLNARKYIGIFFGVVLVLTVLASSVMAGNPLENDTEFLMSDPDGDAIKNWEEFLIGTDPFNADSDNDGLPDWWELEYSQWVNDKTNARLDPTDASDAHLDFDFEPYSDASGYNIGERDAKFNAVQTLRSGREITWPSNPNIRFIDPVFDEEQPHYDNYEEYYRPYTDLIDLETIRYMHTSPIYADTDGDGLLDPDDYQPLSWPFGGISPGGADGNIQNDEIQENLDDELKGLLKNKEIELLEQPPISNNHYDNYETNFDLNIEIPTTQYLKVKNSKHLNLPDVDNDGI